MKHLEVLLLPPGAVSYPDVSLSLSMKICVQKKAGRRKRASRLFFLLPIVPYASSPVTRVSRSPM